MPSRLILLTAVCSFLLAAGSSAQWTPLPVADDPLVHMPGTQPGQVVLQDPSSCLGCHGYYDNFQAPGYQWQGSMMSQSARDFLFWAALTVAAQDSIWAVGRPNATDACLRCHMPKGWLEGRSDPTNGSLMTSTDFDGVQCDFCHRMYDPFFEDTYSGSREGFDWLNYWDETGLSATPSQTAADVTRTQDQTDAAAVNHFNGNPLFAANKPVQTTWTENGTGQFFVSGNFDRRASFADAGAPHGFLYSRYHKSKYFCGTCHDVSNPILHNLPLDGTSPGDGTTILPSETDNASGYYHVERTFSEFLLSDYGQPGGAPGVGPYAPDQFTTSLDNNYIARCQDCHIPDTGGVACNFHTGVIRPVNSVEHPKSGLPRHDLTGANIWVPWVLASSSSTSANYDPINDVLLNQGPSVLTLDMTAGVGFSPAALLDGVDRAKDNLTKAAAIESLRYKNLIGELSFRVQNQTGHKLITGYGEGRRMFLNIRMYSRGALIHEINPYDDGVGTLKGLPGSASSPALGSNEQYIDDLVYEKHSQSSITGETHTLHFILGTERYKDNRIPPKGFRIADAPARQAEPYSAGLSDPGFYTPTEYAGGYDEVVLNVPKGADTVEVCLYYQVTSREYIEFLRDEIKGTGNTTLPGTAYIAQSDPFFSQLKAWGDTIWQLWDHNKNIDGAKPFLMTKSTFRRDSPRQRHRRP